jgi:hypothetical protein
MARMRRPAACLVVLLAATAVPAAQAATTPRAAFTAEAPFAAAGSGSVRVMARGEALVSSAIVRPGTLHFRPGTGPSLALQCLNPRRPPVVCARVVRSRAGVVTWRIVRPVRFLYEGADFTITIATQRGFRVLMLGSGRVVLRGTGQWSHDGGARPYAGVARLELP